MEPLMVTFMELKERSCRWPVNNTAVGEQHLFCGHDRQTGSPYCPFHEAQSRVRVPMRLRIIPTPQRRVAA
jgi:hypothetical protein